MYSVSKIFKYCINASRFVYIFQKHTRETKKLSLFFFSRRSAINTIHPLYVVEEETPKRETSEARRINPPRFPATSPFSTPVSLSLSRLCSLLVYQQRMVLHRCFIVPWYEKASASIVPKSSVVFHDKGNIFFFLSFLPSFLLLFSFLLQSLVVVSRSLVKKYYPFHLSRTTKFETRRRRRRRREKDSSVKLKLFRNDSNQEVEGMCEYIG